MPSSGPTMTPSVTFVALAATDSSLALFTNGEL
jgi:hypothetical protein